MPYVQRDARGQIESVHRQPEPNASEFVAFEDPDLQAFLGLAAQPEVLRLEPIRAATGPGTYGPTIQSTMRPGPITAANLVGRHGNMIVVRSFSKALGLAGERVGYMFLSDNLARYYRQIDVPFEPGIVAATLAREALADTAWLARVRAEARSAKARIVEVARGAGLEVLATHPDVAILSLRSLSRNVVAELGRRGIRVLAGSSFTQTHPGWDDRYCRLRVVHGEQLEHLCRRIASL